MRMILQAWFGLLEENFSYKEVQFKKICLPVKTSYPPNETVMKLLMKCCYVVSGTWKSCVFHSR